MTKCRDTGNEYLRDDDEEEEDETLDVMEELKAWDTSKQGPYAGQTEDCP